MDMFCYWADGNMSYHEHFVLLIVKTFFRLRLHIFSWYDAVSVWNDAL